MKQIFTLITFFITILLNSQTLNIDTSFGTNGYFELTNNSKGWDVSNIIENSDGTILLSTQRINGTDIVENIVVKLTENGIIDTNFGANGIAVIDVELDNGLAIKKQDDGKIILFGGQGDTKIIRLLTSGQLDTNFGTNGEIVLTNVDSGNNWGNNTLLIQNNKIIVLAGSSNKSLTRFNTDGTIDTTFGSNGSVSNIQSEYIYLDNSDNIVGLRSQSDNTYTIEKFNNDGQINTSFGTNGLLQVTSPVSFTYLDSAYMDLQNRLLLNVALEGTSNSTFSLIRANADGTFDNSFSFNNYSNGIATITEKDSKYVLGGATLNATLDDYENLHLARIDQSGNYDNTFNNNGEFTESGAIFRLAESLIILNNGSILVSGERKNGQEAKMFVSKYNDTSVLSVFEINELDNIAFKNPVENEINIISNNQIQKIEIYSLESKLINSSNSNIIETSFLNSGLYVLKVYFINGTTHTEKIIKK